MFKKLKNNMVFLWGFTALFLFSAVDYNLFGLFGGFGWSAVLFTLCAYIFVLIFLLRFIIYIFGIIFKFKKQKKETSLQYGVIILLSFFVFIWLDNRDPSPNSNYSDVFSK